MPNAPRRPLRNPDEPQYTKVPVENLRYDPENPRLGGTAKHESQEEIQKYLAGPPHYALDLVGSFLENGFLPYEPLIVRRENSNFIVIEGNRRLAAVQSILSDTQKYPQHVRERLHEIPVLIFPDGAHRGDSEEALRYLGVKHLFGFRDWPPTSKAMFLDHRVRSKKSLEQVLKELNISRQEVARYLLPYRLKQAARRAFKKVNAEDFWSLAESFGRKKIRIYVQLDVDTRTMRIKSFDPVKLGHLAQFLYGKRRRVTDTRQLSTLGKVLGSPRAAAKLERGASLEEASLFVASKEETIMQLQKQLERLLARIKTLSPGRAESVRLLTIVDDFAKKLRKRI
jgi:ParB/Sulfiredoxin domain